MYAIRLAATAAILLSPAAPALAAERPPAQASPAAARPQFGAWGVDLSARDLAVRPGQDFNLHANGTYIRTATIPADKTSTGGFMALYDQSQAQLLAIVEELSARGGTG